MLQHKNNKHKCLLHPEFLTLKIVISLKGMPTMCFKTVMLMTHSQETCTRNSGGMLKMTDMNLMDQMTGHEIAGHEM